MALQLIELTPYVPPPPVIQPSRHFPPSARRLMRTPSLSTITDRRESGTSFDVSIRRSSSSSSSSAASSSAASGPSASSSSSSSSSAAASAAAASSSRPASVPVQPPQRLRSLSSASSDSTLSSDSQHTNSSSRHELAPVQVQDPSPPSSYPHIEPLSLSSLSQPPPELASPKDSVQSARKASFQAPSVPIIKSRKKDAPPQPPEPFYPLVPPNGDQLARAAELTVVAHDGKPVRFGDLFQNQRTIVLFLRHFWCPLCQDYMYSVSRAVDPACLDRAGVRLVIVSHGAPSMIKSYRQIFRLPPSIPLYTDPSRALYVALGMTLRTLDPGPEPGKGDYIRHSYWPGIGMVVKNAIKTRMPLTANGGDVKQLGGEFILGPGMHCSYTSRMSTTRGHTSINVLLDRAGVAPSRQPTPEDERVVRAVRSLPARALRAPPTGQKGKEPASASEHGHGQIAREEERARREELREICDRRLSRRGGLTHLKWEGDCGLYEDDGSGAPLAAPMSAPHYARLSSDSDAAPPSPGPAYLVGDQVLVTEHKMPAAYGQDRARRISDPGPALVAEWLAVVQSTS